MTAALEGGEWSAARPGRTLPPGKTRYPFYRRLGGPQGRSGRAENLVPTGIRSWTMQHVGSRLYRLSYRALKIYLYYHLKHIYTSTQWWNINDIRATCFRPMQNIYKVQYVLHWPDDGCFTAETCSPDVIDISLLCWCTYVVFQTVIYIYLLLHFPERTPSENNIRAN